MNLYLHLSVHLGLALLAGFLVWGIWKKPLVSFFGGIIGGVLIDFDHFYDYFLAFGNNFNFQYFTAGYQFMKSDKLYILFHGWEYVILSILVVILVKKAVLKAFFLALALGIFFHLAADVHIDRLPFASYSVINRACNEFNLKKLVYLEHWKKHLEEKEKVFLK